MIKVSLLSAFFMLVAFSSYAQRGSGNYPSPEQRAKQQTAQMTEYLKLTDEQAKKVGDINLTYANKMMETRKEAAGDRTVMRTKMEAMMKEKSEALKEVLTDDQFKNLEGMRSQYQNRGKGDQGKGRKGRKGDRDK
jgi:hypothetical protein